MSGEVRATSNTDWAHFEAVVLPHLEAAHRLAMWLTRDREEAQDLVQETFVQALQSFHRFVPGTNARAWVLTIMRHTRSNRLRRIGHEPRTVDDDALMERLPESEATPQHVTDEEVLAALARLPTDYQEVVLLADVEDLSYKEIATMVQVPLGTVMSRLHRARRLLRTALSSYAGVRGIFRPHDAAAGGSTEGRS
jgi:RNA polymerase sigma-70 factor (ECF subfamily)